MNGSPGLSLKWKRFYTECEVSPCHRILRCRESGQGVAGLFVLATNVLIAKRPKYDIQRANQSDAAALPVYPVFLDVKTQGREMV